MSSESFCVHQTVVFTHWFGDAQLAGDLAQSSPIACRPVGDDVGESTDQGLRMHYHKHTTSWVLASS